MKIKTSVLVAMVVLTMMFALGRAATRYSKAAEAEQSDSTEHKNLSTCADAWMPRTSCGILKSQDGDPSSHA
jgi:hypothetical protein